MQRGSEAPLKVCVVTGARSEYGLMRWMMEELRARPGIDLQLVATGAHYSERHGLTYREIEADGFVIDRAIPIPVERDEPVELVRSVGVLTSSLGEAFTSLEPDLVLVMGDRYELLAVAAACILMTIPLGHLSGGEITEGAIDDQVRHSLTKSAHLHLVTNRTHAHRVFQMGEEDWRVCIAGEPGLDALHRMELMSREELCADLGIAPEGPVGLVSYHPATLAGDAQAEELHALDQALRRAAQERSARFVISHPNADAGNRTIVEHWTRFVADHPGSILVESLGHLRYLSALKALDFMVGNSSSGLVEAPSFNLPSVNVGERQAGRERGANVIDVPGEAEAILEGLAVALAYDRGRTIGNPYGGDGRASIRIVDFVEQALRGRSRSELLRKRFVDLP